MSKPHKRRTSSANGNGGGKWVTPVRRLALYLRAEFTCVYGGCDLHGASPHDITLDHVRCRRGDDKPDHGSRNLVVACRRHNSMRQDKPLRTFLRQLACAQFEELDVQEAWVELRLVAIRRQLNRRLLKYTALAKSLVEERRRGGDERERSTRAEENVNVGS